MGNPPDRFFAIQFVTVLIPNRYTNIFSNKYLINDSSFNVVFVFIIDWSNICKGPLDPDTPIK